METLFTNSLFWHCEYIDYLDLDQSCILRLNQTVDCLTCCMWFIWVELNTVQDLWCYLLTHLVCLLLSFFLLLQQPYFPFCKNMVYLFPYSALTQKYVGWAATVVRSIFIKFNDSNTKAIFVLPFWLHLVDLLESIF